MYQPGLVNLKLVHGTILLIEFVLQYVDACGDKSLLFCLLVSECNFAVILQSFTSSLHTYACTFVLLTIYDMLKDLQHRNSLEATHRHYHRQETVLKFA